MDDAEPECEKKFVECVNAVYVVCVGVTGDCIAPIDVDRMHGVGRRLSGEDELSIVRPSEPTVRGEK